MRNLAFDVHYLVHPGDGEVHVFDGAFAVLALEQREGLILGKKLPIELAEGIEGQDRDVGVVHELLGIAPSRRLP
ncbi:hypothetical protein D3C87_2023380 [compost metagenome]